MTQIFPLSEGVFTVGHDKMFVPFDASLHELNERATGSLLVEILPFLVVTDKDVLVLDTGLGFKNSAGEMQISENLRSCGYSTEQVTKVLLSHLHKDHVGGAMCRDAGGLVTPTFPNAEYYIYRAEADYALQKGGSSYPTQEIEQLLATTQVHWLDGEEGLIDGYIRYTHSGGHCPQHIVFLVQDGADNIFYGGDEAPQLKQLKMRYIAKYDYDGKKAMQLREQYAQQGSKEGWTFLFYHDIKTPIAKL